MIVNVNNKACELPISASVSTLLDTIGVNARKGVAIAVNSDVVPQAEWATRTLNENDKIMIIKATQGG